MVRLADTSATAPVWMSDHFTFDPEGYTAHGQVHDTMPFRPRVDLQVVARAMNGAVEDLWYAAEPSPTTRCSGESDFCYRLVGRNDEPTHVRRAIAHRHTA
jgi:hypothetical protein